ncbi:MAG: hypothetical protein AB8F74_01245 [Saprospiraceae bacterium]
MESSNQALFEQLVLEIEGAEVGQMFGKQCGKLNKKAFVAFYEEDMVFRIGREAIEELLTQYSSAQNWDPSGKGRAMKDWIQVPETFKGDWKQLTRSSADFLI